MSESIGAQIRLLMASIRIKLGLGLNQIGVRHFTMKSEAPMWFHPKPNLVGIEAINSPIWGPNRFSYSYCSL